jgi:hypothetical protein
MTSVLLPVLLQFLLEVAYARKVAGPHCMPVLAAVDLGSCLAVFMPLASSGSMLDFAHSLEFQQLVEGDPAAAGTLMRKLALVDYAKALVVMKARVRMLACGVELVSAATHHVVLPRM